jgi:hypothetical protein
MAQQDEGFQLVQSRIGSDLSFFSPDLKRRMENYLGWPDLQTRIMELADLEPNKETAPVKEDFPWMENSNFLAGVSFWGGLKLPANRIGGSLDLRCATIKGPIYLNDTAIGLDLYMDGSIEERVLSGDAQKQFIETTCLHLNAEKMTCEGDINFTGLRVLREMNLSDEEQPYLDKQKLGSLLAQEAQVKGQMLFVAKDAEAPDLVKYAANKRELAEFEANAAETEKKNEAVPANLKQDIKKLAAKIVELEKKIGAAGLEILDKNQFVPGYALIDGVSAPRPALDLTSVKAGYLLLTGCNVPHRAGSVRLERGAFGRLEIIEPSPGPIDLSKISVDRWVFGKNKEPRARDYVKVLEKMEPFDRSTWINVETALRNLAQDGEANKVYRKMRKKARADASKFTGSKYFGFLKPSHIYLVLVAALIVYLAVSGVFPTPVNVAILLVCVAGYHYLDRDGLSYLLGFGTFAWVPILLAIPLFFLSYFWVFSNPEYVRASSNLLEVLDDDKKVFVGPPVQPSDPSAGEQANAAERRAQIARAYLETSPDKIRTDGTEKWNRADAAALTLRYQVPIIPIMTHGWWEANSSQIKYFRGITAEQYALFLYYYHWIAWSLFLIWLAARIVRGKQN